MDSDDHPKIQQHLVGLLTLFSRNTVLLTADSSITTSTWFSIAIRSTPNTLCDIQCKRACCQSVACSTSTRSAPRSPPRSPPRYRMRSWAPRSRLRSTQSWRHGGELRRWSSELKGSAQDLLSRDVFGSSDEHPGEWLRRQFIGNQR